jgi:hypothetical protein
MRIAIPFQTTDFANIAPTIHPGETGFATWRTIHVGSTRIRQVDYSPNYLADHWCEKGHLLFVLEGEILSEVKGSKSVSMTKGMSYQVSDGLSSHRSYSKNGATLLIIDGEFLAEG